MSYHFLCPNPVPLILQIPNIYKYMDLTESILCVSEIRASLEFIPYSTMKWSFSSLPIIHKKNYYNRYYDILHRVARILRQCGDNVVSIFFFCIFTVIGFSKSTGFEFEFSLRIPVVSWYTLRLVSYSYRVLAIAKPFGTFIFRAYFGCFHSHSFLLAFLIFVFSFHSYCCHAREFEKTLVHGFRFSYSHTKWNLLSSLSWSQLRCGYWVLIN